MTEVVLGGCRPEPLGSYLKSLGVFRLVATQRDPRAVAWWDGDLFCIDSALDRDAILAFLLESYEPTPVLSPWNKDAGFKEPASTATKTLLRLEATDDPRLGPYRVAIAAVRRLRAETDWDALTKEQQVTLLRNELSDQALDWLSAAVVVGPDQLVYPAVLGTGGNLGRLELSPTFMDRVMRVLDPRPKAQSASRAWLVATLLGEGSPSLLHAKAGQFDPGAAGGVRSSSFGQGRAMINPWDLVLTIEGSVTWASGAARRLDATSGFASIPFSVTPSPVGQASMCAGESAKAELWAPIWRDRFGWAPLVRLFNEGRISWNGRQARYGLDAARAVSNFGVDAGIDSFVRYLVAERMGTQALAVPIGRFRVGERHGVGLLGELDGWIDRFRRVALDSNAPTSLRRAHARVEQAVYRASAGTAAALQEVLIAVGAAEAAIAMVPANRDKLGVPPVPWLTSASWLPELDDATPELRLAAALALGRDPTLRDRDDPRALLRTMVRPIEAAPTTTDPFGRLSWTPGDPTVRGLGSRPIEAALADVLVERSEAEHDGRDADEVVAGACEPWFPVGVAAAAGDAESLASGMLDLRRLERLLMGLLLLRPVTSSVTSWKSSPHEPGWPPPIMMPWRLLAPFYTRSVMHRPGEPGRLRLRPRTGWARRLVANSAEHVIADALLRMRFASLKPVHDQRSVYSIVAHEGRATHLLAAALLCGSPKDEAQSVLDGVVYVPMTRTDDRDHTTEGERT